MNKIYIFKLSFLVESLKLLPLQGVWVPAGYSIKIVIPSGVPADLKSAVKKGSTYKNGGFGISQSFDCILACCGFQIRRA